LLNNTRQFRTSTVIEPDVKGPIPDRPDVSGMICRLLGRRCTSSIVITARPRNSLAETQSDHKLRQKCTNILCWEWNERKEGAGI